MRKWIANLFRIIFLLLLILLAIGFFFPAINCHTMGPARLGVIDIAQLITAVKSYEVDYGKYPDALINGRCETAEANAKLLRILLGLDPIGNPRKIRFIEVLPARKKEAFIATASIPKASGAIPGETRIFSG